MAYVQGLFPPPVIPPQLPTFPLSAFFLSILQWTALELEWPEQDGQLPEPCAPEREAEEGGAHILMRCTVSMATLSEEGKKKRVLSLPLSLSPHSPLLCAPSSSSPSISCPPPQLARGFVRRQMIPQMPRPSRPFQLHSPASP